MAGLLDALSSATTGLAASELGLEVAGQNLANVNTVGYSRRTLNLAEVPATSSTTAGRGVDVVSVAAQRDQFAQAQIWKQQPTGSYQGAVVNGLANVNAAIGLPGAGLDSQLGAFFDSFATLSTDPTSVSARDAVVTQGQTLASAFNQMAQQLTATQQNADENVGNDLQQINQLTTQIAQLNGQIANSTNADSLVDQRNTAISTLSTLAGVDAMQNADGTVNLTIGKGGSPLVIGTQAFALSGSATPPQGLLAVNDNGEDITSQLTTGQIGGLLQVRDTLVPGYQNQLDQLAYSVATNVNTVSQAGFDASGNPGVNFFTPPSGVSGTAALLAVNPAVRADSSLVVASSTGAAGDSGAANAIAGLRNQTIVNGSAPADAWGQIAYAVGSDISNAQSASTTSTQIVQQLQSLQAQTSGVSMDEEAANLMKFQRSYEASARYFTTVVTTLDTLMTMVQ